ncbi:hypothetical protein [Vulcanisaeta distributa]|uniref:hypothetical protein n=1 Tax=Vulcanisaeta distributa TaxID=164451 RepID=UPI0006D13702|nr:hypothetical protein [Vulcanisaeta distributa]
MNNPFAFIRSRTFNREFTIYYQPSIYPHITSAFTGGGRLHLIPDIVVFEGVVDEFLNWGGGLHRLIDGGRSPLLIVEVKTGVEL